MNLDIIHLDTIIYVFEILGVIAFAFSGAILAIKKSMDLLGVIVLAVTASVGGGIIRDMILGVSPPLAFRDPSQAAAATAVAVTVFCAVALSKHKGVGKLLKKLDVYMTAFDTVGLAAFTVTGVSVAHGISAGYSTFLYVFVGTLTGVGGGIMRDVLARELPYIFVRHIYALASLAGALVCSILWESGTTVAMILGAGTVILIRIIAIRFRLKLPRITHTEDVDI